MGTCETNQISVTIDVASKPAVTFKQSGKLNLFYADGTISYTVTSKNQIENVELGDGNDAFSNLIYDGSTVTLNVDAKNLVAYKTNKQKLYVALKITLKDYGTFTQDVLVSTENKPVTLTVSNASVVQGQTEFTTTIVNSKTKETVTNIKSITVTGTGVTYSNVDSDGIVTMTYSGQGKAVNYTAKVSSSDWTADVTAKGKVTYVANPKLVLGSKTAIISDKARTSKVSVSVKDCDKEISNVTITAKDKKAVAYTDLSVKFKDEDQSIVANLAENAKLTKGTYSYTLTGKVGEKDVKLDFKVSVLDAKQTVTVQLKSKGSINLVNSSEYITLTPTLKNTTASVVSAELASASVYVKKGTGKDVTDQFSLEMLDDGTLKLGYNENATLIAKTQYEVKVNFKLDDETTVSGTVKVTPVIKLPTVKADVSKGTLYNSNSKAFTANITSTSKTGTNAISNVVFDTTKIKAAGNRTADELFDEENIFEANDNNSANGTITIQLKEDAKNMNLNLKNCSVTALVYYKSGTTDASNTPVKVKFTITVK
jgi:Cu/Ag efflux protein CusF